jgi:alkylhydroperoxidase/carboxymuconolactone decarboxylase family protein YurZ
MSTSTDPVAALDPVFAQMSTASLGYAGETPGLTEREKVLLCLVADVCQQSLGLAFELHVRRGLAHGVSTGDVRTLLRLISYDTGYHAALDAFARLAAIEAAAGLTVPATEPLADESLSTGPDAAQTPLPAPVRAALGALDPHFAGYVELQSRMRAGHEPGTLSDRERAFATMSVDVHYQTLEESFRTHVDRALRTGVTAEDVRAVLRFTAAFGVTRVWRAWKALNAHFTDSGVV